MQARCPPPHPRIPSQCTVPSLEVWREAAQLRLLGRAKLPASVVMSVGEWGAEPRVLGFLTLTMVVTDMECQPLTEYTSSGSFGLDSSSLHLPDIYCPTQTAQ